MIARQRIRLPHSYDLYYDVLDLNIGREVTFFGKVFKVFWILWFWKYICYQTRKLGTDNYF